jgi:4-diphosphocytidyl-2-C-methyl-D-erythritol kinase
MTDLRRHFLPAFAKINLTLDVLGKRPDGYHELASVMQTVSLSDTICITASTSDGITCETDILELRTESNLALRAGKLLAARLGGHGHGARIELRKEVPAQGGLGGGSSDAATVLAALNALWNSGYDEPTLEALAAELGSDVSFFIRGGTCLIEGRGERVTPLPDAELLWVVLAKPPVSIPTPAVFRALAPSAYSSAADSAVIEAIRAGDALPFDHLSNALEPGVLREYPAVAMTRDAVLAAGAPLVRMSGSGPTLYAPFRRLVEAAEVLGRARAAGVEVWLCHSITGEDVARSRAT